MLFLCKLKHCNWNLKYKLLILCKFSPCKLILRKFLIYNILNDDILSLLMCEIIFCILEI
jgi:hypothetical protein